MFIRKALVALASAGMVFGSTAAAAAPVAVDDVRASSRVGEAESMRGSFAWILAAVIIAAVIGIIAGESEELSVSP